MKKFIIHLVCGFLGLALFAGCQSADPGKDSVKAPLKAPASVAILFGKPTKSYVEVGGVATLKVQPTPGETWQHVLQRQAGASGADAIIVDTSTLDNSNTPMVTGKAIRYQEK